MEIDRIQQAIQVLESVCRDKKFSYTLEYIYSKKLYRMRFMSKQWLHSDMFEVYKEAILYVAVAEGYVPPINKSKGEEDKSTVIHPSDSNYKTCRACGNPAIEGNDLCTHHESIRDNIVSGLL